ncbi:MAG: CapA family protein [Pseudomonadales bacterium]
MKLMFVGDINLGEYYPSFGHGPRTYASSKNVFANVQSIFDTADLVVGNLEAPITNHNMNENEPESMVLRVDPSHAGQLKAAGFGVLQVANNHTVQHGAKGFDETLSCLEGLGIQATGLNKQRPVSVEHDGLKIGFLAASDVPDNTDKSQQKYQRLEDEFVNIAKEEVANYDHLIVMLHWGLEASTGPLPYQREMIDQFYAMGISAVIGSHPHLFYEIEKRENFVSAYSLGNFVFDLCWDARMNKSGILELDLSKNSVQAKLWPVELKENGCLPTPTGESLEIDKSLNIYKLGEKMDRQQMRKTLYLIRNLHKGNTAMKIKFFQRKILSLFRSTEPA